MKIEIYINNNQLESKIIDDNKLKKFTAQSTMEFLKKIKDRNISNINGNENAISFTIEKFNIKINDYNRLKNLDVLNKINTQIEVYLKEKRIKEKLKKNKKRKTNRLTSLALGIAGVVVGSTIFIIAKSLKNEKPGNEIPPPSNNETIQTIDVEESNSEILLPQLEEVTVKEPDYVINLSYEDLSNTEKAINTRMHYGDLITKYSLMYGIDPNLMIALATQERGTHSSIMDSGGATGLMQIQNSVFVGQTINAYNYETNSYDELKIDEDNIGDLETNIKAGCMIFWKCLDYMEYNPIAAIQCYNMGYGNMEEIIDSYCEDNNLSKKDVLHNCENVDWLEKRKKIYVGDQKYVENVLSWIIKEDLTFKNVDGNNIVIHVSNKQNVRS